MTAGPGGGSTADDAGARTVARGAPNPVREESRRLLAEYQRNRDPAIRDRLVELNSDLVHYIARRFANKGEPLEDIE
ncbi:MAG: flagellar biosynthesis protein FliA, partial [Candidatus Dormibacteria bacterium]